jgi:hypothetical protein
MSADAIRFPTSHRASGLPQFNACKPQERKAIVGAEDPIASNSLILGTSNQRSGIDVKTAR